MKIKLKDSQKILLLFCMVSQLSLSIGTEGRSFYEGMNYDSNSSTYIGVGTEDNNFYKQLNYDNSYSAYIDFNKDSNSDNYKYILGDGVISYGNDYFSEYNVQKKFEKNVKVKGEPDHDNDGWETTVSLYKILKPIKIGEKELYNDFGGVYYYDQLDDTGTTTTNSERHEFQLRYRLRVDSDIGKGGSYSGVDLYAALVDSNNKSGSRYEIDFLNTTNLGYGFQNMTIFSNEILDYDNYDSTYKAGLENTFRWTYEFNKNWAFSPEFYVNLEKYSGGTTEDYDREYSIIPYILYNTYLKDNLNLFAKIGLFGYGEEKSKNSDTTQDNSGMYYRLVLGIKYFW